MHVWGGSRSSIRIFACWIRLRRRWHRREIRDCRWRNANGGGGARRGNKEKREEKEIDTEDTERGAQRAQSEKERERWCKADDGGSGAVEFAGGAADAWVSGERRTGAARSAGLGGDFSSTGVLLAREIGAD